MIDYEGATPEGRRKLKFPWIDIGCSVFVHNPAKFIPGAECIIGDVLSCEWHDGAEWYTLANVYSRPDLPDAEDSPRLPVMTFAYRDIAVRGGTPISKLSGRPGHPGYGEFVRIANSWGYP